MTECNFRQIRRPLPGGRVERRTLVFGGTQRHLPGGVRHLPAAKPQVREIMMQLHKELFDANYWKMLQSNIKEGMFEDVYPYRRKKRFRFQRGDDPASGTKRDAMVSLFTFLCTLAQGRLRQPLTRSRLISRRQRSARWPCRHP